MTPRPPDWSRFAEMARKLVAVPKKEVDRKLAAHQRKKAARKKAS